VADGSDITISGGGSIAVATEEMIDRTHALESLRDEASAIVTQLLGIDAFVTSGSLRLANAPISALDAESEIDLAVGLVRDAGQRAAGIARALRLASLAYGIAENAKERVADALAAQLAYAAGVAAPLIVLAVLPALPAGIAGMMLLNGKDGTGIQKWIADNNRLLTNPLVVELIRQTSSSLDDLGAGLARVPPGVPFALGDEGTGAVGADTTAALVTIGGTGFGFFRETGVSVKKTGTSPLTSAPDGFAERIARIPRTDENGGSQVTVEKYTFEDGRPDSFAVYIAGTADFSPSGTTTPFDFTSDVRGVGNLPAGSVEAVKKAMTDAGVTADSPVTFTGHSLGALTAHILATSGEYNTKGLLEVGGPTSKRAVPDDVAAVSIAHTDDIVTGLGGRRVDDGTIIVEREAFRGKEIPTDEAVPAHSRDLYEDTARMLDESESLTVKEALAAMEEAEKDATEMTTSTYQAVREREKK
jgi:hypothetical protein